jgi:hypothetical protein
MSEQVVTILKDSVLEYVALHGSILDVDKEARRFVASSKDSAVKELSKTTVYSRADLIKILNVATVGEVKEYEGGSWVYIPENPKAHPNLMRFYKKYHPDRYLETVIHGYPKHYSEEDVREAPKSLPKSFMEYLLRRGSNEEITFVARALFKLLTDLGVPGLKDLPMLSTGSKSVELNGKIVHGFLSTLNEMGLHVGDKVYTQVIGLKIPRFMEEYLVYEEYMLSTNAENYSCVDAQRAAKLLTEGFQTTTPPDEPLTRLPDLNSPPTEVAEVFEYFLYYGSDIDVDQVTIDLILNVTELDFNLKYDHRHRIHQVFLRRGEHNVNTRLDLLTILTHVNPRSIERYYKLERTTGVLTLFGKRNRITQPDKDIRDHPALAKYYRREFVLNYIDMLAHNISSPLQGVLLLDEIESLCPANLLDHCLKYGTDKEVSLMVETIISRHYTVRLLPERPLSVDHNEHDLYTRGDLRLLLKELPQKNASFDPNEGYDMYRLKYNYTILGNAAYNEIVKIRYASQVARDKQILDIYERGDSSVRNLVEGFAPPFTKNQHRKLLGFMSTGS